MQKTILFTLVMIFVVLVTPKSFSQSEEKAPSYFSTVDNTTSVTDLTVTTSIDPTFYNQQPSVSTVYLTQIGSQNIIDVSTESGSSQNVYQRGNENFYQFRDSNLDTKVTFGVRQTGDNNSLKIFGTNSSMNNAVFNQYGGAKAVVNYYKY